MKEWPNDARSRKRYPRKEPFARSGYSPKQHLLLMKARREWEKREQERRCRHYEEMTGKQKIAAGAGTPTTTKEKLLQSDDTIISGKSQVRPIKKAEVLK